MQWIKKTLLFFSCFVWTQQLLSLSTLSLWHNINKERILKRKNTQETTNDKRPKQPCQPKCFNCQMVFCSNQRLDTHLSNKVCQRNYTCTIPPCHPSDPNNHFSSSKKLVEHMLEYKKKHIFKSFQCDFADCDTTFADQDFLEKHKKTHLLPKDNVCDLCFKSYKSVRTLTQHKRDYHNPKNPFVCGICKLRYSKQDSLINHRKIHFKIQINKFSCLLCIVSQGYNAKETLTRHTKEKHSYYKCKYKDCKEAFILGSLLLQHIEKQHAFSPIPCPECPQLFHGKLTLYQHRYMEHEKYDKNTFIEFLKDFIEKNLNCSYPFYQEHPFFHSLFLEKQVLTDTLLSKVKTIAIAEIPIEILPLYKQFIENITSKKSTILEELSLDVLLSYEGYRLSFSYDSAIWLLFLKDILSIMIENRNPLETTYKEMLDILYTNHTKDTNQFSDEEYLLFMKEFKKIFFKKLASPATLQDYQKNGLRTESSVIDKTLESPNISIQESINPKQLDDQKSVPQEYLPPYEQMMIGVALPSVNTVFKKNADTMVGSPVAKPSEYDLKNIENDLNNLNDSHQGNPFSFEDNDELPTHSNVKRYA